MRQPVTIFRELLCRIAIKIKNTWMDENRNLTDLLAVYIYPISYVEKWWRISDSNRSPQTCHACALPDELIPQNLSTSTNFQRPDNIVSLKQAANIESGTLPTKTKTRRIISPGVQVCNLKIVLV